jgi:hypothetical protein
LEGRIVEGLGLRYEDEERRMKRSRWTWSNTNNQREILFGHPKSGYPNMFDIVVVNKESAAFYNSKFHVSHWQQLFDPTY